MGPQQVLRTAACALLIAGSSPVSALAGSGWKGTGPKLHEPVAVVDLGPGAEWARVQAAAADGGLDPVLVGIDRDAIALDGAMHDAEHAFGALKCGDAVKAAKLAIGLAAERQAAGLAVPELTHAWAYLLLCADKNGDTNSATLAATRLRALGGSTDIDASLLARYPDIDAVAGREVVEVEVVPEVAGATVYVDFQPATGTHLVLPAGEHVIAAASGARRGYVAGPAVPSQKQVAIPMPDQTPLLHDKAAAHTKIALVRRGDVVEAWGATKLAERPLAEVDQLVAIVVDRLENWDAPAPGQPLLVEDVHTRAAKKIAEGQEPTKWWVYATIGGALLAGAIVIYAHESASDTQRVELHYP
jgi:hypothetical protein